MKKDRKKSGEEAGSCKEQNEACLEHFLKPLIDWARYYLLFTILCSCTAGTKHGRDQGTEVCNGGMVVL
jgi:hypothetical protein